MCLLYTAQYQILNTDLLQKLKHDSRKHWYMHGHTPESLKQHILHSVCFNETLFLQIETHINVLPFEINLMVVKYLV